MVKSTYSDEYMTLDHLSLITTPIELYKGEEYIGQGTGFFYCAQANDVNSPVFLVTNFHVLTGFSPNDNEPPIGDNIFFYIHEDYNTPGQFKKVHYRLFRNGKSVWVTSKKYPLADVAIIPLTNGVIENMKVISEKWINKNIKKKPTSLVTLIGYPHGFYDQVNFLPIYKSGHIASEPDVDFEDQPNFVVDVSNYPGMSGSPVFMIKSGAWETEDGHIMGGETQEFLGIFSADYEKSEKYFLTNFLDGSIDAAKGIFIPKSLELGVVWKASILVEMVKEFDVNTYNREILGNK
jgi:hypothetical protein